MTDFTKYETQREILIDYLHVMIARSDWHGVSDVANDVIPALRARLSAPEPEPVGWHEPGAYGNVTMYKDWAKENGWLPLYAASPQREWQGLTDEEIMEMLDYGQYGNVPQYARNFVDAIEAKLKEKNT